MESTKARLSHIQILLFLGINLGLIYALPTYFNIAPPTFISDKPPSAEKGVEVNGAVEAEIARLQARMSELQRVDEMLEAAETKARTALVQAQNQVKEADQLALEAAQSLTDAKDEERAARQALIDAQRQEQTARRAAITADIKEADATSYLQNARAEEQAARRDLDEISERVLTHKKALADIAEIEIQIASLSKQLNQTEQTQQTNIAAISSEDSKQEPPQKPAPSTKTKQAIASIDRTLPKPGPIIRQYENKFVEASFIQVLPEDLSDLTVKQRKDVFLSVLLPLILRENQNLEARAAILEQAIATNDNVEIERLAKLYRLSKFDGTDAELIVELRQRIAPIPVSLALAQAAVESGWGLSRFAKEGNALFGQWAWSADAGIKPRDASNSRAVIRSFATLYDSVVAYMHNLNTHYAYAPLREARYRRQQLKLPITGLILTEYLAPYAETGKHYVFTLKSMIIQNRFDVYEDHQLAGTG